MKRYGDGVPEDQVAALIAQYRAPVVADEPIRGRWWPARCVRAQMLNLRE